MKAKVLKRLLCPVVTFALSLLLILLISPGALTYQRLTDPRPNSWVYDRANLLDSRAENEINQLNRRLQANDRGELMVVTLERAKPEPNLFATNLFNDWGIGNGFQNNGVLFLIAKSDRRAVIRTGSGRPLSDFAANQIINRQVLPNFKQRNYQVGILAGARAITAELNSRQAESIAPSYPSRSPEAVSDPGAIVILLLLITLIAKLTNRGKGSDRDSSYRSSSYDSDDYHSSYDSSGGSDSSYDSSYDSSGGSDSYDSSYDSSGGSDGDGASGDW